MLQSAYFRARFEGICLGSTIPIFTGKSSWHFTRCVKNDFNQKSVGLPHSEPALLRDYPLHVKIQERTRGTLLRRTRALLRPSGMFSRRP